MYMMDAAMRLMVPALLALAALVLILAIRLTGWTVGALLKVVIRSVGYVLTFIVVSIIQLGIWTGRGIRALYWRFRA